MSAQLIFPLSPLSVPLQIVIENDLLHNGWKLFPSAWTAIESIHSWASFFRVACHKCCSGVIGAHHPLSHKLLFFRWFFASLNRCAVFKNSRTNDFRNWLATVRANPSPAPNDQADELSQVKLLIRAPTSDACGRQRSHRDAIPFLRVVVTQKPTAMVRTVRESWKSVFSRFDSRAKTRESAQAGCRWRFPDMPCHRPLTRLYLPHPGWAIFGWRQKPGAHKKAG